MVFDTTFRVPWALLGYFGVLGLMALLHGWLFKGCERYTRGELSRAFPEVARPVLINRVISIIAPVLGVGLLLLGIYGILPRSTALLYATLCFSLVPITELRLSFGFDVHLGGTIDGVYYVRESLPPTKRLAIIVMKQIAPYVALVFFARYVLIAVSLA
ncbi:hypothetical protein IH601_08090 [Candidatus Bipolaricaulota bacterium]|nr:hypothetical protein [Candidatus Bipolaricaulota bacterium]